MLLVYKYDYWHNTTLLLGLCILRYHYTNVTYKVVMIAMMLIDANILPHACIGIVVINHLMKLLEVKRCSDHHIIPIIISRTPWYHIHHVLWYHAHHDITSIMISRTSWYHAHHDITHITSIMISHPSWYHIISRTSWYQYHTHHVITSIIIIKSYPLWCINSASRSQRTYPQADCDRSLCESVRYTPILSFNSPTDSFLDDF